MTGSGRVIPKLEHSSRENPSTRRSSSKANHTSRRQSRQSRIVPVQDKTTMHKKEDEESLRRSSRRFRENLKIDTNVEASCSASSTPATVASTTFGTPMNLRDNEDLRSPGIEKTPMQSKDHIPDFITQTDRYGNAITPRSETASQVAKKMEIESRGEGLDHDPCDTFFDSIRSMCCCLVPDSPTVPIEKQNEIVTVVTSQLTNKDKDCNIIKLLPPIHPNDKGKKCLVLDLDETLVHSSFRAVTGADFVIPVQIEDVVHFVYVMKRPGVDNFLLEMSKFFEIIIYTASLNKYADPLLDLLDTHKVVRSRLFRESCVYYEGSYVKDLSIINRDLSQTIIVDNSPNSYIFHPENAIDCSSFIDDPNDRELEQIGACLMGIKDVKDVRNICTLWREWPNIEIDEKLSLKQ